MKSTTKHQIFQQKSSVHTTMNCYKMYNLHENKTLTFTQDASKKNDEDKDELAIYQTKLEDSKKAT